MSRTGASPKVNSSSPITGVEVTGTPEPQKPDMQVPSDEVPDKPKTPEEMRAAIMDMLKKYFAEGEYHIEVAWDKVNGGFVKLRIIPKAEWEAEQAAQEDGSGYTPKGNDPERRD